MATSRFFSMTTNPLVEIENLQVTLNTTRGKVYPIQGVSCVMNKHDIVGVVGESGSGKTMFALALGKLIPGKQSTITADKMNLNGYNLLELSNRQWRDIRGKVLSYIFQDALVALHPHLTVGYQLMEPLRIHFGHSTRSAHDEAIQLLRSVHIPDPESRLDMYPHQLSGGMRQRVAIAMALITRPQLLIADEPTTALDATLQLQVWQLLRSLYQQQPYTMILITHDLSLVAGLCNYVWIMYAGRFLEMAPTSAIFRNPLHPYTHALLSLRRKLGTGKSLRYIPGNPPQLHHRIPHCPFAERCPYANKVCTEHEVQLQPIDTENHLTACIRVQRGEIELREDL